MENQANRNSRTQNRVLVDASDEKRAELRNGSGERRRASGRVNATARVRSDARSTRAGASDRGSSRAARPTQAEVTRNRVIAIAILVVLVALLVNLITCVARGIGGGGGQQQVSNVASTESGSIVNTVAVQAGQQASSVVPAGSGVEDPWVPGGRFTTGDAELDQLLKSFCDGNSEEGKSAEDNAFNVYCAAMWAEFVERDNNQHPTGPTWDIEYAKQALKEYSVNCYEQVAVGEFILKYFGYSDATAEPCLILRQSGEYGDHGLLYVTNKDGRKCLCDPAFGANGWMLDADIYTVKVQDVGQDPADFKVADFEEVVPASWVNA